MKKLFLALFLLLGTFIVLSYVDVEDVSAGEVTGFDFTYNINLGGNITPSATLNREYGDIVSIDAGTLAHDGHEYVGFLENGKVLPVINGSKSFRITETTNIEVFYKPTGSTVVIFMDANQDYLEVRYTDATNNPGTGNLPYNETDNLLPDHTAYTKPGLTASGWTADGLTTIDFSTHEFTEDTIVFPLYQSSVSGDLTLSVENGTVNEASPYSFNQTVTVSANGTGTFNYWLKDGIIASLDETYSFTMADNHDLVAVYDSGFVADSDIFISANGYMVDGSPVILGQFDIPEDEDLVEWGILTSAMPGGITFDTPDVTVVNSSKYNPNTNEFVLSFDTALDNFRAFIKTVNQTTGDVSTVYSYVEKIEEAQLSDLFISEYIEGSSNNKAIEIYNGTGQNIDLTPYTLEIRVNDGTDWEGSYDLTGTLNNGEALVVYNSSSVSGISDVGDIQNNTVAGFNGDDAIGLLKNGNLVDIFGVLEVDPGSYWVVGTGTSQNHTLVRKDSFDGPKTTWDPNEWDVYPEDTFDYLGSHGPINQSLPAVYSELPSLINISGQSSVNVGETITLTESYPNGGLEGVIWVSSNESLATVDSETGVVTGVAEGNVTIAAYSYFNHSVVASQSVNVLPIQTYDVTFDSNEGSAVATQTINGGETATEPTDPTRTGFEFAGWYTDDTTFLNLYNFANEVTEEITLYAKWNEIYDITYNLDSGTNDGSNPATYTVATPTITLAEPTKSGFVFDGWYEESDFSGTEVTEITVGTTGDITLYAKWVDEAVAETTYVETFNNFPETSSSYKTGSYLGDNSVTWSYTEARGDSSADVIDGPGLMLAKSSTANISATIQGGISSFSIQYTNAFSTAAGVKVYINGTLIGTSPEANGSVLTYEISNINVTGEFTIEIMTTNGQLALDNLTWETYTNPQ
jgi:uncharacterized repeat protein (TIGR02543 family)